MEALKEKINIPNIMIVFILLQPVLDIITSLCIEYAHMELTLGIIIRSGFMIFCVIIGWIKANKKYRIGMCAYYVALAVYVASFLVNSYFENGTNLIFIQIKGLVKSFYLPIIVIALIPVFKEYRMSIDKRVLKTSLMIYVITIFVCSVIGIAFPTYKTGDRAGTVGLFYSANEIGAILCLLSPFLVVELAKKKLTVFDGISLVLFLYAVLQIGTKVPYFGLILLILTMIISCFVYIKISKKKELYRKAGLFFSLLVVVYLVTGITPIGENLTKIYGNIFLINKEDIQFGKKPSPSLGITEFKNFEELKTVSISGRNDFLRANKEKFLNGNLTDKMLGIGFVQNDYQKIQELKLTEMDYFDILFCMGVCGTLLFIIPLLTLLVVLIRYGILYKRKIEFEAIFSLVIALFVALLAGHVFVSPAVSIYIAIILLNCTSYIMNGKKEEI